MDLRLPKTLGFSKKGKAANGVRPFKIFAQPASKDVRA